MSARRVGVHPLSAAGLARPWQRRRVRPKRPSCARVALREATREAMVLAAAGAASNGQDRWVEHAWLALKVTAAERAGARALGKLTGAGGNGALPLSDRIHRHALGADAALERAAAALTDGESRAAATAIESSEHQLPSRIRVAA